MPQLPVTTLERLREVLWRPQSFFELENIESFLHPQTQAYAEGARMIACGGIWQIGFSSEPTPSCAHLSALAASQYKMCDYYVVRLSVALTDESSTITTLKCTCANRGINLDRFCKHESAVLQAIAISLNDDMCSKQPKRFRREGLSRFACASDDVLLGVDFWLDWPSTIQRFFKTLPKLRADTLSSMSHVVHLTPKLVVLH